MFYHMATSIDSMDLTAEFTPMAIFLMANPWKGELRIIWAMEFLI